MHAAEDLRANSEQWSVYESGGNCVVLAGPGSGKTKTLTIKMARMLAEDVRPPRGIACITYNNQCARELRKRLSQLGAYEGRRAFIGTLHSFCLQSIVMPYAPLAGLSAANPVKVASTTEIKELQEKALKKLTDDERWGPRFDNYRRTHLNRTHPSWKHGDEQAAKVIETYEALLAEEGLIDFDSMVLTGLQLVREHAWVRKALKARFPILVIDEYQDLGRALHEIVTHLCFPEGMQLLAVGDPDQSIYGFTGAEPSLLRELAQRPDVAKIELKLNYRCGSEIIHASEAALGEERDFESASDEPGEISFHERPDGLDDQAKFICTELIPKALARRKGRKIGDIAVLYLDKNDGDAMAAAAATARFQFIRVDGNNPYQPSPVTYWLEDCAAWCVGGWRTGAVSLSDLVRRWLAFNSSPQSDHQRRNMRVALVRFLRDNRVPEAPLRDWLGKMLDGFLQTCLDRETGLRDDAEKVAKLLNAVSVDGALQRYTVAIFGGQKGSPDQLNLSTLHSAKGLEYDIVILPGLEEGRIPYYNDDDRAIREKRRLFYVGLTRARHEVHLLYSGWYENQYGRRFKDGPSRFVEDVQRRLGGGASGPSDKNLPGSPAHLKRDGAVQQVKITHK
jgi:DNA helicase-2/ATP-dependent DNA helicase PcrA